MIYILAFLMNITTGLIILSNPLVAIGRFQADALMLGILGTGPALVYALGCAGSGFWIDRIGYRKMIIIACILLVPVFTSILLVSRFRYLLALSLMGGVGLSIFWPAMIRWVGEEQRGGELRRKVGNYNIALIGGVMVGPLIGGVLIVSGYIYPYLLSAGLVVAILAILFIYRRRMIEGSAAAVLPVSGEEEEEEKFVPGFMYIGWAANFAAWFAIGGSQALFPELAKSLSRPISDQMLGILISLVAAGEIVVFVILRMTGRWHYRYSWLFIFQILGIGGLIVLSINSNPAVFLPAFLVIGFAGGMTYFSSIYYSVHKQEEKGRKSGFHESFLGLGIALGPITGGLAVKQFGLRAPYLLAIAVFAASIIVQVGFLKKSWGK